MATKRYNRKSRDRRSTGATSKRTFKDASGKASDRDICVTDLKGREGSLVARTFKHSIILTLLLGVLVVLQQYLLSWIVP